MAKMIPKKSIEYDFHGSEGEEQVYNALSQLPDPYIIFHSVSWNNHDYGNKHKWGESDFVIFHPKRGVLVVEVKAGEIKLEDGRWFQTNRRTKKTKHMKDPLEQANRSKYNFIRLLQKNFHGRNYHIEPVVWFSSITSDKVKGNLPLGYTEYNLLFSEDIKTPISSIEQAFNGYGMISYNGFTKEDEAHFVKLLAPCFNAVLSMAGTFEQNEYWFNRLTKEQSLLIDYLDEQDVAAIQGGAGTGKTMLAIEKAKRLPKDEKVLFLCYNIQLLSYLRNNFEEELLNVDFYNLFKLRSIKMKTEEYIHEDEIIDYLENYERFGWDYKHIIIDEGQDFPDSQVELLRMIAMINEGCFYIFYDKKQMVQQWQDCNWMNEIDCRLVLYKNCRNTVQIAVTAYSIAKNEKYKTCEQLIGEKPLLYTAKNKGELISQIKQLIDSCLNGGVKIEQITILTSKTIEKSTLQNISKISNIDIEIDHRDKGILFTTARKFKGLESESIILLDVDEQTFTDEKESQVFYVGSSRAKNKLDIIFDNSSELSNTKIKEYCDSIGIAFKRN